MALTSILSISASVIKDMVVSERQNVKKFRSVDAQVPECKEIAILRHPRYLYVFRRLRGTV